jgi:energy-coupling factor transporter transmembrane protein EcfT
LTKVIPELEEFWARRSKKRLLVLYFSLLAFYVLAVVGMVAASIIAVEIYHVRSVAHLCLPLIIVISVVFVIFSFVFLGVKYSRTRKYVRLFDDIRYGLTETGYGVVKETIWKDRDRDGLEFYTIKVDCDHKYRPREKEARDLLVYAQAPIVDIADGTKIKFVTHGNVLLEYDVIEEESPDEKK